MGSWWGVFTHTAWFTIWLIFDFSLERLTFWVSLEAIFIGIFLLMSANKAEVERDRREARERAKEMQQVQRDVELDTKEIEEIKNIKDMIAVLQKDLKKIRTGLDRQSSIRTEINKKE